MSSALVSFGVVAVALTVGAILAHTFPRRTAPVAFGSSLRVARVTKPETEGGSRECPNLPDPDPDPDAWRWALVSDLSVVQELLDWAERRGYRERELLVLGDATFLVRWRHQG
jgi:hypothetical protein